jgi:DNA-binding transcriptional regulator WhiA
MECHKRAPLTQEEIQILETYYPTHGAAKCREFMPYRSQQNIRQSAFKRHIKINREVHNLLKSYAFDKNRKYKVDENLFNPVKDPEIAYLLGIMWADGYIHHKCHSIIFESLKADMDNISNIFAFTGNWNKTIKKKFPHILTVQCFNYRLGKYLQTLDYHKKSGASAKKVLDTIPKHLKHYWWRGYLDGDGCIDKARYHYTISFSSVYDQNWDFIYDLHQEFYTTQYIGKKSKSSRAAIHGKKVVGEILKYIYQGYEQDKIGLSRKYDVYKNKYLTA